jgi:hypothetical protein
VWGCFTARSRQEGPYTVLVLIPYTVLVLIPYTLSPKILKSSPS